MEKFAAHGLPAGECQTIDELYQCAHLVARQMFLDIDDPHAGIRRMIRTPFLTDVYEGPRADTAPQLGADNHLLDDLAQDLCR